jgi:hypothetical protein
MIDSPFGLLAYFCVGGCVAGADAAAAFLLAS